MCLYAVVIGAILLGLATGLTFARNLRCNAPNADILCTLFNALEYANNETNSPTKDRPPSVLSCHTP